MKSLRQHINEALKIKSGTDVKYDNSNKQYFYHEALEDGYTTKLKDTKNVLQYSIDNCQTWNYLEPDMLTPEINKGDRIYFKGETVKVKADYGIGAFFSYGKKFNIGGNIMSLIYPDDFSGQIKSLKNKQFFCLFYNNMGLISAKDLILPATNLSEGCYGSMFYNCKSLTTAPELPATKLAEGCYNMMFYKCKSLKVAPKLHATKLTEWCYSYMFDGCNSLNEITMLATDISAIKCLKRWLRDVPKFGTFIKAKGIDIEFGVDGIPEGWDVKEI